MLRISCPCGAKYQIKPEMLGRSVTCKKCTATFVIKRQESDKELKREETAGTQTQKAPPSFTKQQTPAAQQRREREDALLANFTSKPAGKSLDERIAERHKESIERDRTTNSVKYIVIGLLCIAAAVATWFIFRALDDGGVAPRIVWFFKLIGGKYWIPPLLTLIGLWQITIGVLSLFKFVDIDEEEQLPTRF